MKDIVTLKGIRYLRLHMLMSRYGGMSRNTAVFLLESAGIKVSTNRDYCYSMLENHYVILVQNVRKERIAKALRG